MSIPDFQSCMFPLLKYLANGQSYRLKDAVEALSQQFELTSDECSQLLPSQRQGIFENRVAWARSYLKQAGLLEYPERGLMRITLEGKRVITSGIERVDTKYLKQYPSFQAFQTRTKSVEGQLSDGLNPDDLEDLLLEFAEFADDWFTERPFVVGYWKFMVNFFLPDNLKQIEWTEIQKLGSNIHSLQTNALARARAFGNQNFTIQQYRDLIPQIVAW
ncbi:MAG: winged helix-turn-helix domain-containing protein [Pseudomonadota bacterium]